MLDVVPALGFSYEKREKAYEYQHKKDKQNNLKWEYDENRRKLVIGENILKVAGYVPVINVATGIFRIVTYSHDYLDDTPRLKRLSRKHIIRGVAEITMGPPIDPSRFASNGS